AERPEDYLAQNFAEIRRFGHENAQLEAVRGRDYDGLEAALRDLARRKSWKRKGAKWAHFGDLSHEDALSLRDLVKLHLDGLLDSSNAELASLLQEELQPAIVAYDNLKARAGRLDFLDLLLKTRDLIRDNAGVRSELQGRFSHFFVDE